MRKARHPAWRARGFAVIGVGDALETHAVQKSMNSFRKDMCKDQVHSVAHVVRDGLRQGKNFILGKLASCNSL